jgi:L-iditol 2-dehydrogenase
MSFSAFSTRQHGCPVTLIHSFRHRWSLTAIRAYDTPVRAVVLDERGQPQLADVNHPEPSFEVLACGLCGSDVEKLSPEHAGAVLGHEVVVRDGSRRLALIHHLPCGACARCRAGHESTCEQFAAPTIVPGGFAERVQPADGVELPDSLDDAHATMVEPLACVLRALERVPRGRVLVVGNGFVGRLFGAALERRGDDVFAIDSDSRRSGRAPDGPVDAAIVCARDAGWDAMRAVEPGGTILAFTDAGEMPADYLYRRELTLVGSRSASPASMQAAAVVLPELDVPEPTVLPLTRFGEGLDLFLQRKTLKVVFTP